MWFGDDREVRDSSEQVAALFRGLLGLVADAFALAGAKLVRGRR